MSRSILYDAMDIQDQDEPGRPHKDGGSIDPFYKIAHLWNAYLGLTAHDPDPDGVWIGAADVAIMMALLKIGREAFAHSRDNMVDLAGYAHCAQAIFDAADALRVKPGDMVVYVGKRPVMAGLTGRVLERVQTGVGEVIRVEAGDAIHLIKECELKKVREDGQ